MKYLKPNFFYTLTIIACIFIFTCCNKPSSDLDDSGLKGKVRSVREITYQAIGNKDTAVMGDVVMGYDTYNCFAEYNEYGNLTDIHNYDTDNELVNYWHFFYNDKQLQTGANYYYKDNSLMDSTVHIYDNKGNRIEYKHYKPNGILNNWSIAKYDKKGNCLEEIFLLPDNITEKTVKCKYKGKLLTEDSSFNGNNSLEYRSTYIYDKNDNLITHTIYNHDGKIHSQGIYSYNQNNDIIMQKTFVPNSENIIYTYKYTYDNYNNWTQKITFINSHALFITKRQIIYY